MDTLTIPAISLISICFHFIPSLYLHGMSLGCHLDDSARGSRRIVGGCRSSDILLLFGVSFHKYAVRLVHMMPAFSDPVSYGDKDHNSKCQSITSKTSPYN